MNRLTNEIEPVEMSLNITYTDPKNVHMEDIGEVPIGPVADFELRPADHISEINVPPPISLRTDTLALRAILNGYEKYSSNQAKRVSLIAQRIVFESDGEVLSAIDAVKRARAILESEA